MAGVSESTASKALTGNFPLAAKTKAQVLDAADKLGYLDLLGARPTRNISIIARNASVQFVAAVVDQVADSAWEQGHRCSLIITDGGPERELTVLERLCEDSNSAAVVVVGGYYRHKEYVQRLRQIINRYEYRQRRIIFCGRPALGPQLPSLSLDYTNLEGAFAAANYLLELGHSRLLIIGGPQGFTTSDLRMSGWLKALKMFGLPPNQVLVRRGPRRREFGFDATRELLIGGHRFSAILADSDLAAVGALEALRNAGRQVPRDVSVVGFDDLEFAEDAWPPLTTVHVPFTELGNTAAAWALARETPEPRHVVLGTELVERDTVGAPSHHAG
jgi:LacI family transcriptional regulator